MNIWDVIKLYGGYIMGRLYSGMMENYAVQGFLYSYSQIFFTKSLFLSISLLLISFIDVNVGISGVIATGLSILLARLMGYSKEMTASGTYGYNTLLVGMGIGISFKLSLPMLLALFFASALCFFITIAIEGVFYKYGLPILSIPFIVALITFHFAKKHFYNLGINENWLFESNELYKLGGAWLTSVHEYINENMTSISLRTYFHSLGAIAFQVNILSGMLIALGLFLYSRIFFLFSLLGFYSAILFYQIMGVDISSLAYSYIGFNFILTSIAAGSFFLVPDRKSLLWTVIMLPLVAIITLASYHVFAIISAPIYAVPFNIITLMFLYILKLRIAPNVGPEFPVFQYFNPEQNLYYHRNFKKRFPNITALPIYLPFWGKWTVSQGHNGEHTHKNVWKEAWDFVITDENKKQFSGEGNELTDYYCYDKPIVAPADGYVVKVVDHIQCNAVGDVNIIQNWGNTVVINHGQYLYTKVCHLKAGSIQVAEGSYVHKGQILGNCGNSGRSPYPHLHFQVQAQPDIGAPTIDFPFAHYLKQEESDKFLSYQKPEEGDIVSNIEVSNILEHALNMMPGQTFTFSNGKEDETIAVETDPFNNRYITSRLHKSKAYFQTNEVQFHFSHFEGSKKSVVYQLYQALFRVQFGFYMNMEIQDDFPINSIFPKSKLFFHDLCAPFGNFIKSKYSLCYEYVDNESFPTVLGITSELINELFSKECGKKSFVIEFNSYGISQLCINEKGIKTNLSCTVK